MIQSIQKLKCYDRSPRGREKSFSNKYIKDNMCNITNVRKKMGPKMIEKPV